jgi:hypothetical protein
MLEERNRPERTNDEEKKPEKALEHTDDPILRKLRQPNKDVHRVKYKDGEYVVTSEDDR